MHVNLLCIEDIINDIKHILLKNNRKRTFLGGQWLRICLPMQGGRGFDPWFRKIPHAAGQLSPGTTTTAPALQRPRAANTGPMGALGLCSTTSRPRSPQLEKCSNEDPAPPNQQKLIKKNHYKKKETLADSLCETTVKKLKMHKLSFMKRN